jgi:hypothetical protein
MLKNIIPGAVYYTKLIISDDTYNCRSDLVVALNHADGLFRSIGCFKSGACSGQAQGLPYIIVSI